MKFQWYILAIVTLASLLTDGYTSISGIANILRASNTTTWLIAITTAFVVNIVVGCSHIIFQSRNFSLIVAWLICLFIDAYTTVVVINYFPCNTRISRIRPYILESSTPRLVKYTHNNGSFYRSDTVVINISIFKLYCGKNY